MPSTWSQQSETLRQMALALSIPIDDFVRIWHTTFDERMKGYFEDTQSCIAYVCIELGLRVPNSRIESAALISLNRTKQEVTTLREHAIEVLSSLKSKGYKTGLVSNCSTEVPVIWRDTPFAHLIDVSVFSCSLGIRKPDPDIFLTAVEKMAVSPPDCLYIADGIDGELACASKLGMRACMIGVPGAVDDDPYREKWDGGRISSLWEVLSLVN